MPWLHVTWGEDPSTGKRRVARGFIACGDIAVGILAFGGYVRGLLACGGCEAIGLAHQGFGQSVHATVVCYKITEMFPLLQFLVRLSPCVLWLHVILPMMLLP